MKHLKSLQPFIAAALLLAACSPARPSPSPRPSPGVTFVPAGTPASALRHNATDVPLGKPVLLDRSPVRGEALEPDKPLVLTFDQPMNRESVQQALAISDAAGASISGTIEWQGDNVLAFKPAQQWERAASYAITLSDAARSAKGLALAKPEAFNIDAAGKLLVARTIPLDGAQDTDPSSAITVLFNRPVVPLTSIANQAALTMPVRFEPPIDGAGQWLNTSIYVFRPTSALAAGTTYRGIVAAGLRDTSGALLEADASFAFTVAPPAVTYLDPAPNAPNIDLRRPVTFAFSQLMDHASVEAALTIDPPIAGKFVWSDAAQPPKIGPLPAEKVKSFEPNAAPRGESVGFHPDQPYARATKYTFTLNAGAKAKNGAATATAVNTSFTTIPLPAIVSTEPANGGANFNASQFTIKFSAPVSPATILPNLTFTPEISLTEVFSYFDPYTNQFSLNANFKPSTAYRVRIGDGIGDDYGATVTNTVEVRFTTKPLSPFIDFADGKRIASYNASGPTAVFASYRNVTDMNFTLARLTPAEFHRLTGSEGSFEAFRAFKPSEEQTLRTWKVVSKAAVNQRGLEKLILDPDGGALTPGIYLLRATAEEITLVDPEAPPTQQILIVSNRHITLKLGEKNALVWVTDLNSGRPVGGANVVLYDKDFKPIGEATTETDGDTIGHALIELPIDRNPKALIYAFADLDGPGFTVVRSRDEGDIGPYWFNVPVRSSIDPWFAHLHTDRPLYRPGQMVFYKGIVRAEDDARYSVNDALLGLKPTLQVFSPQGQTIVSRTVTLNASGAFSGELALDNQAEPGYYNAQLCVPTKRANPKEAQCSFFSINFIVANYRRPEFEVAVTTDKADYQNGNQIVATVAAKYYFGGNVANAQVTWNLTASDWQFDRYTGDGDYNFGDYDYALRKFGFGETIANGSGQTDASGFLTLTLPADLSKRAGSARFSIEVSVTDANDQAVAGRANAIVHKGPLYFGVAPADYVGVVGVEQIVNVIAVDWSGKPLPDTAGEARFFRRQWFTTNTVDDSGFGQYNSVPSDTLASTAPLTTDADGKATVAFTPQDGGKYRIAVDGGGAGVSAAYLYVSSNSDYVSWRVENSNRVQLQPDKTTYAVGDVARVLVPSPFQGATNALLTIERGGFLERKNIVLPTNSTVLEIPVTAAMAPNAYVSVLIVKGVDANDKAPAFRMGVAQFGVDPGQFKLNIAITPDRQTYGPRETATYQITVTDAAGQPVQAELSVAVADKAVLSLSDPNSGDLLASFYGLRALSVRTADSLTTNVDRFNQAAEKTLAKGGGGGGGDSADGIFTRGNFKDTAYWSAVINTDANGIATVQVPLPDNLTTWVMDVRGVTNDTRVGQARNEVVASKPLLIRPVAPRFMVAGDTLTLGAVVNNNSDTALDAEVILDGTGVVFKGDTIVRVNAPARGIARVNWDVQALDVPAAVLTFTVKSGPLQDSSTPTLATAPGGGIPILRYSAPETVGSAGVVSDTGAEIEVIALPARLDTGRGDVDIRIDTSLATLAAKAGRRIESEEVSGIERVAAAIIANSALLDIDPAQANRAEIERGLQRLFNTQRSDGGWSWWLSDAEPNPFLTAYVLQAIADARDAGYSYDNASLSRARDYLVTTLQTPASDLADAAAANRRAVVLYALSRHELTDAGQIGALYENRNKLGHYGRALLALTIADLDASDTRIKTLLSDLQGAAIVSGSGMHWQERARDTANFFGNTRSTSIVLFALSRLDGGSPLIDNAVRWLLTARDADWWESTHESAWAVRALAAFAKANNEGARDYPWRVALNEQTVMQGSAKVDSDRTTLPVNQLLRERGNQLVFERGNGTGNLYYTARVKTYLPVEEVKAIDRGMVIARKYERADCAPEPGKPCAAIDGAKIGETVRVRLTLVLPSEANFVRIVDPLPAGAEAIDAALKTSAARETIDEASNFGGRFGWGWWYLGNAAVGDDRVTLSASYLPAGTYEFTYLLRPSIVGDFHVMPALAEEQYFPEVFGRGDGARFVVSR